MMLDDFIFNDGECQINICGVPKVLGQKENNDIENNQFKVFSGKVTSDHPRNQPKITD